LGKEGAIQDLQAAALTGQGKGGYAFCRPELGQLLAKARLIDLRGQKLPGGDVQQSQAQPARLCFFSSFAFVSSAIFSFSFPFFYPLLPHHRSQKVVAGFIQHGRLDDGSRRDHPGDLPFHQAAGKFGVLHLVADGHLVPGPDEPGQIGLQGVIGDAGQGDLIALIVLLAAGEDDVQVPGHYDCIIGKGLVEVAHPEQ